MDSITAQARRTNKSEGFATRSTGPHWIWWIDAMEDGKEESEREMEVIDHIELVVQVSVSGQQISRLWVQ